MDDLDLSIYRWMFPGGVWSFWGIDPRITNAQIARRLGLGRKAVWARIREWRDSGLWQDATVRVNPDVLGLQLFSAEIPVSDPSQGWQLMDRLEQLPAITGANVAAGETEQSLDEVVVQVGFVARHATEVRRIVRQLKQISPTGTVYGPDRDLPPRCRRELNRLDWRVLGGLAASPTARLAEVARTVGLSFKTVVRRRAALIDSHAIWFIPTIDWSSHPSIGLTLYCQTPGDTGRVRTALDARFPHYLPMSPEGLGSVRSIRGTRPLVAVRVPAHSPGEALRLELELSRIAGVESVRRTIWGPGRRFPHWVDSYVAERVRAVTGVESPRIAPSRIPTSTRANRGRAPSAAVATSPTNPSSIHA